MPSKPKPLQFPEGDEFVVPPLAAVQGLVLLGGQLPAHIALILEGGKTLYIPIEDRDEAQRLVDALSPLLKAKP